MMRLREKMVIGWCEELLGFSRNRSIAEAIIEDLYA